MMRPEAGRRKNQKAEEIRPRILFISRKWPPAVGGMETYGVKLTKALEPYAHVSLKVLPGHKTGAAPGLGRVAVFGLGASIRTLLERPKPDIVHIADMSSWPLAVLARLRWRAPKIVLSAHGTDVAFGERDGLIPKIYALYMGLGAALAGRLKVIANSRATREKLNALGFNNTEVVTLATDMVHETASSDLPRNTDTKTLLFAGRLVPRKGCRWFIETVLPSLPEDTNLHVAGTIWDPEEEAALNAKNVLYLGALPPNELMRAYSAASAVIVPNIPRPGEDFEGFGLVAAEAASAGGLVVASAHSGLNDALIDGVTGFHLPPGDSAAWIEKLTELLRWPEARRTEFVSAATVAAHKHFSWERVGHETYTAYGLEQCSKV